MGWIVLMFFGVPLLWCVVQFWGRLLRWGIGRVMRAVPGGRAVTLDSKPVVAEPSGQRWPEG